MTKSVPVTSGEVSDLSSPAAAPKRFVDSLDPRLVNLLTVVGFALPVSGYFWFLHRYSVNVILGDPWDDVNVINHSYTELFDWSSLWAQHNENRIFFPNLIVLVLAYTTHYNVQVEEYLGAIMLTASTALLISAHKCRSSATPWLYYCPVAILMFSVRAAREHAVWIPTCLVPRAPRRCSDAHRTGPSSPHLVVAGCCCGSRDRGQLLVVAGADRVAHRPALLYYRRRAGLFTIAWLFAAVATVAVYSINYVAPTDTLAAIRHPIAGAEFFLVSVGDVVGINVSGADAIGVAVVLLGLVIVLASLWTLVYYYRRRDTESGSVIGAALICFGLLFAATVTLGRISEGWAGASQSRYRTFDLLILVGLYLAVLDQRGLRWRVDETVQQPVRLDGGHARRGSFLLAAVVGAILCLQIGIGVPQGLAGARTDHANQVLAARILVNINRYPDTLIVALAPFYRAAFIRQMAHVAEVHRLSLFATKAADEYKAEGLIVDASPPTTSVTTPLNGAVLKGSPFLNAVASDQFGSRQCQIRSHRGRTT